MEYGSAVRIPRSVVIYYNNYLRDITLLDNALPEETDLREIADCG